MIEILQKVNLWTKEPDPHGNSPQPRAIQKIFLFYLIFGSLRFLSHWNWSFEEIQLIKQTPNEE